MKKSLLMLPVAAFLLAGCSGNNQKEEQEVVDTSKNVLCPAGAPTLTLVDLIVNDRVEVTQNTTDIPGQFAKGDYAYIVFDSTNATKLLAKQGENAKYEFTKMLTGGNFHLFGFDKTTEDTPKDEDNIIGFNEAATPGKLVKNIYPEVKTFDQNFDGVTQVRDTLLALTPESEKPDWAVIADPVATAVGNQLKNKGISYIDINLQTEFANKNEAWDKDYICQAGLFVNKEYKAKNPKSVEQTLSTINGTIDKIFSNLEEIESTITKHYADAKAQTDALGYAFAAVKGAQGPNSTKNGVGVVPNNVTFTVEDINNFNTILG